MALHPPSPSPQMHPLPRAPPPLWRRRHRSLGSSAPAQNPILLLSPTTARRLHPQLKRMPVLKMILALQVQARATPPPPRVKGRPQQSQMKTRSRHVAAAGAEGHEAALRGVHVEVDVDEGAVAARLPLALPCPLTTVGRCGMWPARPSMSAFPSLTGSLLYLRRRLRVCVSCGDPLGRQTPLWTTAM